MGKYFITLPSRPPPPHHDHKKCRNKAQHICYYMRAASVCIQAVNTACNWIRKGDWETILIVLKRNSKYIGVLGCKVDFKIRLHLIWQFDEIGAATLWKHNACHPSSFGSEDLLLDTANPQNLARERNLAGHCEVWTNRPVGDAKEEKDEGVR